MEYPTPEEATEGRKIAEYKIKDPCFPCKHLLVLVSENHEIEGTMCYERINKTSFSECENYKMG